MYIYVVVVDTICFNCQKRAGNVFVFNPFARANKGTLIVLVIFVTGYLKH